MHRSNFVQNGQTALILAAEKGSYRIVRELLDRNANVNARDEVRGSYSSFCAPQIIERKLSERKSLNRISFKSEQ